MSVERIETRELLARDRGLAQHAVGLAAVAVLFGWWVWAATVEVPLTLAANTAQLVATAGTIDLALPFAGTLTTLSVVPGQKLAAGDSLATLDTGALDRALATARAAREVKAAALRSADREADLRSLADSRAAAELTGRIDAARSAADRARLSYEAALASVNRNRSLAKDGLLARSAVEEADAGLALLQNANAAAVAEILRLELDAQAAGAEREAAALAAGEHRAGLSGEVAAADIAVDAATADRAAATLHAPVAGIVSAVAAYRPGSLVPAGTPLVTIVPDGDRTISARFTAPEALARLQSGQLARFVPAGSRGGRALGGTVLSVIALADGSTSLTVRVAGAEGLPAGLTGELSIEAERRTPLAIVAEFLGLAAEPSR